MAHEIKSCTPQEAHAAVTSDSSTILIDVREEAELKDVSSTVAKWFAMSTLNPETFATTSGIRKDQAVYVLCRSGGRSMRVASALAAAGFSNLTNVAGGITAWQAAGLPVKKG
jgi:rhodanese-related sulfurtransferase